MFSGQDVLRAIERFEHQTKQRIHKHYSEMQREINASMNNLLQMTSMDAESIEIFMRTEVDNFKREIFNDGKIGEMIENYNEGENKSSPISYYNKNSNFDNNRGNGNALISNNSSQLNSMYATNNNRTEFSVSKSGSTFGYYKDGTSRQQFQYDPNHENDFFWDDQTNTYRCKICSYATSLKSTLKTHMEKVHNEKRNFICNQCGYAFPAEGSMNLHIKTYHFTEHKYNCKVCGPGMAFTELKKLEAHMKRKHYDLKD